MRKKQKIVHLFEDGPIHAIKEVVSIQDEEDLAQFWEYIIKTQSVNTPLYGLFASLYSLCVRFLELSESHFFEIILEENNEAYYFTVWNKAFVRFALAELKKQNHSLRSNNKRLSIRILKSSLEAQSAEQSNRDDTRIRQLISTVTDKDSKEKIKPPYAFLSREDLQELLNLSEDMNEHVFQLAQSGMALETLIRLRSTLSMISIILNYYEETQVVSLIMTEFSVMISWYKEEILSLQEDQIVLIEGFARNFDRWLKVLFVYGGAELHFMDRSLRADIEFIRQMIAPSVHQMDDADLDAIFDF